MAIPSVFNILTAQDVDREIDNGFRSLVFAPKLEFIYEENGRRKRERYFIVTGLIATVLYNSFLFCDWQVTRDVFGLAVVARLGIFTPLFLIAWFVIARHPAKMVREGIAGALAIISVAAAMWVLTMSRMPDLASYQYGSVTIMMFTAVIQRLRFRYAVTTIVTILAIQITTTAHLRYSNPNMTVTSVSLFLVAGILMLVAAYVLEHEDRRGFLSDLRNHILNDYLENVAKHDALTGLWNRHHLNTVMAAAWSMAGLDPKPMSVILLDIDHFKIFNDSYGHLEGDDCLKRLAACVQVALDGAAHTSAVRFGGEEFLIFIDGATAVSSTQIAGRIRAEIKRAAIPHPALGNGAIVTASLGVATGPAPDLAIKRLVAAADDALYIAKRAGRDRIWSVGVNADGSMLGEQADFQSLVS